MTSTHLRNLPKPGAYVRAWRQVKAADQAAAVNTSRFDWTWPTTTAGALRAEMRRALDRRINSRGGRDADNGAVDIGWARDAHRLDDIRRRVRVYQFERAEVKARFGHLLSRYDD